MSESQVQQNGHPRASEAARLLVLALLLTVTWLLLSGYFKFYLLALGAASILLCVILARGMSLVDREGVPLELCIRLLKYWPWLAWEIWKASIDVAKRVLDPKLPIHPMVIDAPASQHTDLGEVLYANSITLTPGTTSMIVDPGTIVVHALSREGAEGVLSNDMDRRVSWTEGQD